MKLPLTADTLDRKLRRLEGLADAIRYAPYGFAGFFDANNVKETTLERILEAELYRFVGFFYDVVVRIAGAAP